MRKSFFFFQAEDGIRDKLVTGVQTCALPISRCHGNVCLASTSAWPAARPRRFSTSGEGEATASWWGRKEGAGMAVNQAEADKEIRSQLVSTLESGHNHMALAEATDRKSTRLNSSH